MAVSARWNFAEFLSMLELKSQITIMDESMDLVLNSDGTYKYRTTKLPLKMRQALRQKAKRIALIRRIIRRHGVSKVYAGFELYVQIIAFLSFHRRRTFL